MATIKGQNLRVMAGDNARQCGCLAAATTCTAHVAAVVGESSTKDTEGDWVVNEVTAIQWDVTAEALIIEPVDYDNALHLEDLEIGKRYWVYFTQTATTAGTQNRTPITNVIQLKGSAILSDLQLTAQDQDIATYSAKFTGTGDLTKYTPT
jgi:hypothetical protein